MELTQLLQAGVASAEEDYKGRANTPRFYITTDLARSIIADLDALNSLSPHTNCLVAHCTLCAQVESDDFYTGCLINDGQLKDSEYNCDGKGRLALKAHPPSTATPADRLVERAKRESDTRGKL